MEAPYRPYLAEYKYDYWNSSQIKTLCSYRNSSNDLSLTYYAMILRDLCMGSCSQVVPEQVTCPPETCSATVLFCSQWCSCYFSFHWIKDCTCKYDLFWQDCESHAWYLEKTIAPFSAHISLRQMKFTDTTQSLPQKKIIFGKKLSQKIFNAVFRELERYGTQFLQTRGIYLSHS